MTNTFSSEVKADKFFAQWEIQEASKLEFPVSCKVFHLISPESHDGKRTFSSIMLPHENQEDEGFIKDKLHAAKLSVKQYWKLNKDHKL